VCSGALGCHSVHNDTRNPIRRLGEALKPLTDPAPLAMVMRFDDSIAVLNLRARARTEHFRDTRWTLARQVRTARAGARCAEPVRIRELSIVREASPKTGDRRDPQGREAARTMAG
ncbi:hypothetical protein QWY05_11635, partial [Neisseria gonorrhoeae]